MYLKALAIKGFKSFADPATLHFEPGVTVVVGPNGSGKSNVVDAVAWVLGAQGPRTMRSSKMEDVIFAGSADRPALGRAEVSLTIDNRTGRLPGGLAEITITRTLFRSGDSEYALNGQPCRLMDVQELLSDSGVGRQQHVIMSQGQLDQILQARPEDRRAVIEEAAGVLKHRRRRERAERRLAATEENLERLGDLVREVRRQIRPLERQATAARSHGVLAAELRELRLYLVGREVAGLADRARSAETERQGLRREDLDLRDRVAELDTALDSATAELSTRREEDLVAALTRVQALAERCRGLGGVLSERRRSVAQAIEAAADTDVVSTLEAEAARLGADLTAARAETDELQPVAEEVAAAEAALQADAAGTAATDTSELQAVQDAFRRARGDAEPLRQSIDRERAGLARVDDRLAAIEQRRQGLVDERDQLVGERESLEAAAPDLQRRAADARSAQAAANEAVVAAEAGAGAAERDRHRLGARAEALARAVEEARGAAGLDAVADVRGVLGLVADVVDVDDGWRLAFEAAAGSSLAALVADGVEPARAVLRRLLERGVPGTVAVPVPTHPPAGGMAGAITGLPGSGQANADAGLPSGEAADVRAELPGAAHASTVAVPPGTEPVAAHVRATTPAAAAVLARLVGSAVAVRGEWEEAADIALAHPGLTVVTRGGGRFAPTGWKLQAGDAVATRAAADEAAAAAAQAASAADVAAACLRQARTEAAAAAEETRSAVHDVERAGDRLQAVDHALERLARQLAGAEDELAEARRHRQEAAERVERDAARLREIEERLPELEAASVAATAAIDQAEQARRHLAERRSHVADARRELEVRRAGLVERQAVLVDRLADVERRLAGHVAERERAAVRRRRLEAEATAVERLGALVEGHARHLSGVLIGLQEQRDRQLAELRQGGVRLEELRQQRAEADRRATAVRERLQRLELDLAEVAVRRETAEDALGRELGCSVADALAAPKPELPEGVEPAVRAAAVEAELTKLGPVNPLALDELAELEERYAFLQTQVEDVRSARRELQQVIRTVDEEVVRAFGEAFADVNEHFQTLVATLFPGGTGRLTLTEPEDLLNTGVEVEARPAGKNVRKLTLLSGGERSLVALAFLFAVFRSRPSPFYLMDEVEAALDDVNLHRFLGLIHEFRGEAQLIIVSHQKRTMESADALYGVTMQAGGSSKVVSQKVRRDVGTPAGQEREPTGA